MPQISGDIYVIVQKYADEVFRSNLKVCDDARGVVNRQSVMILKVLVYVLLLRCSYAMRKKLCNKVIGCA